VIQKIKISPNDFGLLQLRPRLLLELGPNPSRQPLALIVVQLFSAQQQNRSGTRARVAEAGRGYEVVVDLSGGREGGRSAVRAVKPSGVCVASAGAYVRDDLAIALVREKGEVELGCG